LRGSRISSIKSIPRPFLSTLRGGMTLEPGRNFLCKTGIGTFVKNYFVYQETENFGLVYTCVLIRRVFSAFSTLAEKKSLFSLDALDSQSIISIGDAFILDPVLYCRTAPDGNCRELILLFIKTILSAGAFLVCNAFYEKPRTQRGASAARGFHPALVAVLAFLFIGRLC